LNQIVFVDYKVSTTIQYWNDKRFAAAIERYSPDKIVIFLGTNNYLDKTLPNVESILSTVKNKSLDCVWLGPVAVRGDKNIAINKLLKRAVGETCVYVDSIDANIQLEDGIHPSSSGIDVWLNLAWDNFRKRN
jgi:lysophospholipase L1-like esterase